MIHELQYETFLLVSCHDPIEPIVETGWVRVGSSGATKMEGVARHARAAW